MKVFIPNKKVPDTAAGKWGLQLDGFYCVIVDEASFDSPSFGRRTHEQIRCHPYFEWLHDNTITHYRWCYYGSSMKFGFEREEDMVQFALKWA